MEASTISTDISQGAKLIQQGKVVAFPTETVYGLGADALNPQAVAQIFEFKERPSFDPLIVHIADLSEIDRLTTNADPRVLKIAERFWPGPLTIILPKSEIVPDLVTSGLPTVGIRMPANPIAIELIQKSGCPLAAPSANKFGRISPTRAEHVAKQLPEVECILDGGKTTVGIESTIIQITDLGFQVLRNGVITREDLETILPFDSRTPEEVLAAPGMMKSHYSPRKALKIIEGNSSTELDPISSQKSKAGLLSFTGDLEEGFHKVFRLSAKQDPKDYAVNMFEALHQFEDDDEIEWIAAEAIPETGVGMAVMDRLRKAAYQWRGNR